MLGLIELIIYWAGLAAGFFYSLSKDTVQALATGDTATLTRLMLSLGVIYLALLIVHRTLRMLWSSFVVIFKLALIALLMAVGVYTYAHGVPATIAAAKVVFEQSFDQVQSSASTFKTAYGANAHINRLYHQARAAF